MEVPIYKTLRPLAICPVWPVHLSDLKWNVRIIGTGSAYGSEPLSSPTPVGHNAGIWRVVKGMYTRALDLSIQTGQNLPRRRANTRNVNYASNPTGENFTISTIVNQTHIQLIRRQRRINRVFFTKLVFHCLARTGSFRTPEQTNGNQPNKS